MSIKKILVIVLVVLVVAVGVALVVVNSKFQVVTASPVVSHKTLLKPETRIQIVANVPLMKGIIEQQFLKGAGIPSWVLPLALPNEVAVLIDADYILGDMNLTLFINDKRLAPIIQQKLNEAKLPDPVNALFPNPMEARGRGKLVREGTAKLDSTLMDFIKEQWPNASVAEPLDIEGGHMLEVLLDNRDGGTLAIGGALAAAAQGIDVVGELKKNKVEAIPAQIKSLRIQADVTPDDALKVHFELACDKGMAPIILMGIQLQFPKLQSNARMIGIDVQGGAALKGNVLEGDYTIPNFTALLALASFL